MTRSWLDSCLQEEQMSLGLRSTDRGGKSLSIKLSISNIFMRSANDLPTFSLKATNQMLTIFNISVRCLNNQSTGDEGRTKFLALSVWSFCVHLITFTNLDMKFITGVNNSNNNKKTIGNVSVVIEVDIML